MKNKKLTDIGSKHILSAWFNAEGTKLVLVEQCTADEIRVVISMPQSVMVSLSDSNVITIKPHSRTVSMAALIKRLNLYTKWRSEFNGGKYYVQCWT